MSPDWTLCVRVYGSRHGSVLEGAHSVKTSSYQQDFCICLEEITNGFEGLVSQGSPPAWKDLRTHKTGSFLKSTLTVQIDKGKWTLAKKWILLSPLGVAQ